MKQNVKLVLSILTSLNLINKKHFNFVTKKYEGFKNFHEK